MSPASGLKPISPRPDLQPDLLTPQFDYGVVDGLGRSWQRGLTPRLDGKAFRAGAAGPLVEIAQVEAGRDLREMREEGWLHPGSVEPLLEALLRRPQLWLARDGRQGFASGEGLEDEDNLHSFKIDAHKAAKYAGFETQAGLLVTALGELIGNVVDHSEAISSGVALFSAGRGEFEIVVADGGIGALRSLTQNPDYAGLSDHGAALETMVETGVSRHARETGHGNGFRPIFEKLADMTGDLRFRSGDYVLTLDGRFGDKIARQITQKPRMAGFLVAISCRISANRFL